MLALEAAARAADAGLWADWFFEIRDASRPEGIPVDRYEIVKGLVTAVAEFDRWVYVNFGDDWRADMTVTVSPHQRAIFREAGMDFAGLEGRTIRVRGWTGWYNGPMIEIDHPEQIELLE